MSTTSVRQTEPKAQKFKLRGERLGTPPVGSAWIGRCQTVGHGRYRISNTGIPKQPTLRVMHQVTVIDEIH